MHIIYINQYLFNLKTINTIYHFSEFKTKPLLTKNILKIIIKKIADCCFLLCYIY